MWQQIWVAYILIIKLSNISHAFEQNISFDTEIGYLQSDQYFPSLPFDLCS